MRRIALWTLALVLFAAVVFGLWQLGWPASRYLHGDFIQYWLSARALLSEQDPYDPAQWRALHDAIGSAGYEIADGFGFLYPLTTAAASLPFAYLTVAVAAPLWFVSQGAALIVGLGALGQRIFARHPRRDLALLFILVAVMQPAYVLAGDGNVTRFLPALVAGSLSLLLGGHAFAAGLVLGLGVIKPQLVALFALALLFFVPFRQAVRLVIGGAITGGGLVAATLWLRPLWVDAWLAQVRGVEGAYGRTNLWGLVADQPQAAWILAGAIVLALIAWRYLRRPPLVVGASVALSTSLFLAPYAAPYDQALLLVGVATYLAVIEDISGFGRAILVLLLLGTSSALGWLSWTGIAEPAFATAAPAPALALLLVGVDQITRAPVRRVAPSPAAS